MGGSKVPSHDTNDYVEVGWIVRKVLAHLFVPAALVLRKSILEPLREEIGIQIFGFHLSFEQWTNVGKVDAEIFHQLKEIE